MSDRPRILEFGELPATPHAREFEGAEHGDVPFSIILVEAPSGAGPGVHRHPYAEVFVIEQGRAEFVLGDETVLVEAGHVVVGPPNVAHGFRNAGPDALRLTAIHAAPRFDTEWLAGADETWSSRPREPEAG